MSTVIDEIFGDQLIDELETPAVPDLFRDEAHQLRRIMFRHRNSLSRSRRT